MLSLSTTYVGLAAKAISYAYYPNGSRQTMTTPAGTFSYNYDAAGRPSSMTNPFSETTSWEYLNNDWLQSQTLANGATANYTYNALGQVTRLLNQISGSTISDFSGIGYDGVSNRNSITASIPGATSLSGTTGYSYDSKDQLTQETSTRNGGFTDNFGYDSAGNPTSFKGVTKIYNSNNQQTVTGFTHDGNGNPITYNGTTLTFDPENRMTAYGTVLTAGYTSSGLRAWRQNASGRTYFLYDGTLPVAEIDSSGSVTATNSFGTAGLVSRREGSTSTFYSFDSEGNVAQWSDASGSGLANHLFSAHGSTLSPSLTSPFGYKAQFGYYTDSETGLHLLTHRYYDPSAGRFLTRDPISYVGGVNLYSYTANNPVNFMDPTGLDIAVIENGPTQGNPFGHTAIAVTGYGVFSFGNGDPRVPGRNIIGGSLRDYLFRELPRRGTRIYIIKTSPEQDRKIVEALKAMDKEPPLADGIGILSDNCSVRSNRGLDAAGIPRHLDRRGPVPPSVPGTAAERAVDAGARIMNFPQNSNVLLSELAALRGFEPTP
ncbi:MAG: RHS repeat-associated core domain-containing protein [Acidobacteriota bacterium]